jgi:hypothetical protein
MHGIPRSHPPSSRRSPMSRSSPPCDRAAQRVHLDGEPPEQARGVLGRAGRRDHECAWRVSPRPGVTFGGPSEPGADAGSAACPVIAGTTSSSPPLAAARPPTAAGTGSCDFAGNGPFPAGTYGSCRTDQQHPAPPPRADCRLPPFQTNAGATWEPIVRRRTPPSRPRQASRATSRGRSLSHEAASRASSAGADFRGDRDGEVRRSPRGK